MMISEIMMTMMMMTVRQWHCQCAELADKKVADFKGRCIFLSNIPSSGAHSWFKRNGKAENQSILISVLVRKDIKDVLMDFKGCCIVLSNILILIVWCKRKSMESICSYTCACKKRHKMCCWRKSPEIKETYIDNASLKIFGKPTKESWIKVFPFSFSILTFLCLRCRGFGNSPFMCWHRMWSPLLGITGSTS